MTKIYYNIIVARDKLHKLLLKLVRPAERVLKMERKVKLNGWDLWKVYKSKDSNRIKGMTGKAMINAIDESSKYFEKLLHHWQAVKGYQIDWEGEGVLQYFKTCK